MNDFLCKMTFGFLLMAVIISAAIALNYSRPKYAARCANIAQRDALQVEVNAIRDQITQTKRNIDRFKTSPYFVERLARMNHRVADNEIVFIFQ